VPERAFLKYQAYAAKEKHTSARNAKISCFIQLENEPDFPHKGFIDFIDNSLDTNTGTIQVRGVIPNPTGTLTPGLFARMRVAGSGRYKALLVPEGAIGTDQNERFLLIVGKDGTVESRPVVLGSLFGSLRSIMSGLRPGEKVVVDGLQMARPGSKVTPQEAPIPPEAIRALGATDSGIDASPSASPAAEASPATGATPVAGATPTAGATP
jgi:RND family efflux transporter MFP subunit